MHKTWNATIDRTTGKELKKQLKAERKARLRAQEVKHKATLTEWQAELRRLGLR